MAENIEYKVNGNKLLITIDISPNTLKKAPMSSSGKTRLVATSRGPVAVDGKPLSFSLNVMTPVADRVAA